MSKPPQDLANRLVDPHAWITGDMPDSLDMPPSRRYIWTLWTAVIGGIPETLPRELFGVYLTRSPRAAISVRSEPTGLFSVVLTDALLYAINTYTRAWTAFHHDEMALPGLAQAERHEAARRSVLDFAWWYRHTGRARPNALVLSEQAEALAAAHAAVATIFLLTHEIAHVSLGHLSPQREASPCLAVISTHEEEYAADLAAASWLEENPPALTRTAESVRILFELLELFAAGTPGEQGSHPLAMRRMLAALGALDITERDAVIHALTIGKEGFWLSRA